MAYKADILLALLDHAALLASEGPSLPVSLPEQPGGFTPPEDGKYIDVMFFPNGTKWAALSEGEMCQGILGVTLVWPTNRGLVAPMTAADQIADHFPENLSLREGVAKVTFPRRPDAMQPLIEDNKVSVPVNVFWEATAA